MSDSNSLEVDPEPKSKRQRTDVNERVFTDPFKLLSTMKDMSILMVGLDGAGKRTILNKLGSKDAGSTIIPGYNIETLVYNNITLKAWDVSGEFKTHLQGSDNFKDTRGLIFVVDSTDRDRLDRARDELHTLLNEKLLKDVAVLVIANKQDEPNKMNEADITERLGLSTLPQRHRYVQYTCATSGAGLFEGLEWLSNEIKHIFVTSSEGVTEELKWLSNKNKKYDDMPGGYTSKPTDEVLVDFLLRLNDGKDIEGRVNRVNLFDNHPALIIRNFSRSLLPCMLGNCKYYLFYCQVPEDAICCELGYQQFQDKAKGVWEPISYSSVFPCGFFDGKEQSGEVQAFRYKPVNEATSCWRMDMYSLADLPRSQQNMVICKVFEKANSESAMAGKSIAAGMRDVHEKLGKRSSHRAKIKFLEAAICEERAKEAACQVDLGLTVQHLKEMVQKYEHDEHKEADAIDPPNRERT